MQQPVPPPKDLPHQKVLPFATAAAPANEKKNAAEDTLFMDHWLLLFNQQEDEDNENNHVLYEVKSA